MKYGNGDLYDGDFIGGKRCGEGIMIFSNGERYEGMFMDDLFNGKGKLIQNNVLIEGYWKLGMPIEEISD